MGVIEGARGVRSDALSLGLPKVVRAEYEFAVDGGAVGDITLRGAQIPAGAIVVDALLYVQTAVTSGGSGTLAIRVESNNDIQTAAAVSGAPWSTTGPKRAGFTSTTAPIKTTAARSVIGTIATAALTAGKVSVLIWYVELP